MAPTKPRIGFGNLLYDNRNHLRASTELSTDYPVANIADWTAGRYWKPTFVSNPPATEYVYCYPLTKAGRIELPNWYFQDWTNGDAVAPDGWTIFGANAAVAKNSTASEFKIDQFSAKITRNGTNAYLFYELPNFEQYRGKELTFGGWVDATVAARAILSIYDGATSGYSSFHSGSGSLVWLQATHEIPFDATEVSLWMGIQAGDTSASFDGVAMYVGDTIMETPHAHAVTYIAAHDHNFFSGGQTVSLESSETAASWGSPTTRITLATPSDKSAWTDASSVSKTAWRVKFLGATGSQAAYAAVMAFGTYVELPDWLDIGYEPYASVLQSELVRSKKGPPIQRGVKSPTVSVTWSIQWVAESVIKGILLDFWKHAGRPGGLAFFFQWDDGDHGTQTAFCSLSENARFSAPFREGYRTTVFKVRMEVTQE